MNFIDLGLDLLKKQDIEEKDDIVKSIEELRTMLETNQIDYSIVRNIYNKYKDEIEKVDRTIKKYNKAFGSKSNTYYIDEKDNLRYTTELLIGYLYRILLYKFLEGKINEDAKESFILKKDKVIYELLSKLVK